MLYVSIMGYSPLMTVVIYSGLILLISHLVRYWCNYSKKYSICKPDHDPHYIPENDKTLLKSDPKMQSCAVISSNVLSHYESNLKDVHMNADAAAMLSEDHENSLPNPPDVISLKCPAPTVLPKHPMQLLSSHQKPYLVSPQRVLLKEFFSWICADNTKPG